MDHPLHVGFGCQISEFITEVDSFWGFWSSSSLQTQKNRALPMALDLLRCRCLGNVISTSLNLSSPQGMVRSLSDVEQSPPKTLSRPNEFYPDPLYLYGINP